MKWAAHRQTTRREDSAYCLMGLFQVNMPLLYGEGDRAFTRLQEEIIQRSDDQSLSAWNSTGPSYSAWDDGELEDPDKLCGLLSPAELYGAGGLQPLPPLPVYASAPSAMTNLGLRVQLYLRPIYEHEGMPMGEDYYAILDCVLRTGDLYLCPAIPLRRLSEDQFARLQTKPLRLMAPTQSDSPPEAEGYRTVYVRQQPVYYHLPQIRLSPLNSLPDLDIAPDFGMSAMSSDPGAYNPAPSRPRYKLIGASPSGTVEFAHLGNGGHLSTPANSGP